jgi:nucleoside-diphosphate-sugar epimerase
VSAVLVTGASSALGRMLVDGLLPAHRVIALAHRAPVDTRGGRVEVLAGGLERCADHAAIIAAADVIVHLAAVTHSHDAALYERVNHQLTRGLIAVARPGQRFVLVSTVCAHERGGAYGVSKLRAEEALRASALDWTIARLSEVFGLGAGEGIDALIALARRARIIPDFREHGSSVRYAPVSGESVVRFLLDVVDRPVRSKATYTLCSSVACTAPDMAAALRAAGVRAWSVPVPLALLRGAIRARLPVPFVADQIDRLVVPKSYDPAAARADHGFEPGDFLEQLKQRIFAT